MISDLTLAYALSFLGVPYVYGGQGPDGADCSGFVILVLQAEGRLPAKFDANAKGLYDYFKVNGAKETKSPVKGCLAFYGNPISHVALCLSSLQVIEAGGGDSSTTSIDEANRRDAHIRIRPVNHRKDLVGFLTTDINDANVLAFPKKPQKITE